MSTDFCLCIICGHLYAAHSIVKLRATSGALVRMCRQCFNTPLEEIIQPKDMPRPTRSERVTEGL